MSRQGSMRRLPWSPPRTPKGARLVLPCAMPRESIGDKYAVNWAERLHVGTQSGLGAPTARVSLSCFFKAKAKGNGGLRSVKVIHKQHVLYPRLFQQQLSDMYHLDHPNIVRLHDVYEDDQHIFLIFDYLAGPSLLEKSIGDPQLCERDAAAAFKVVLQALAYLHERNIVHLNLHAENLRFLAVPKRKAGGSGSAYNDQLKLFDFGLALEIKHLSYDLQAFEVAEGQHLPVLPMAGAKASLGERCVAPEFRSPSERDLGCFVSNALDASLTSPGHSRIESPNKSAAGRPLQEDPVTKQVHEAFRSLEASDIWSAGCLLHLLLTGHLPADAPSGSQGSPPSRKGAQPSALDSASSDARELCLALLRQDPRERPTAAEALQSDWLRRCESLQRIHRSQSNAVAAYAASATTPLNEQVRARLARHYSACRLRKLVLAASQLKAAPRLCALVGADSAEGEGPPPLVRPCAPAVAGDDESWEAAGVKATVISMCNEAYQALLGARPSGGSAAGGLAAAELAEAVEKAGELPWNDPLSAFKRTCLVGKNLKASTISASNFAEFVWMALP